MIGFDDIDYASLSDVGVRRSHNQDSHATLPANDLNQWHTRGHLFLVADGMGAHAVGELASKLAADSIPHLYSKYYDEGPVSCLRRCFVETNLAIYNRGQQNREFAGMGTTGTALLLRPDGAWVGHVGDSRCYRVRKGKIEQLSFDHSLVWELAKRQNKRPEDLHGVPTNVIVRSLGPEAVVAVDVEGPHPLEPGDLFVLCSDGLSGPVSDKEIGAVVSILPPEEACRFLIQLANLQGGPDNITAVVVRVRAKPASPSANHKDSSRGAASASAGKATSREPLWKSLLSLPWPFILILLGIGMGMVAIYLTAYEMPGNLMAFLAAALALLGGLATLVLQSMRENTPIENEAEKASSAPRIYRTTSCAIDPSVVQRVSQAVEILEGRIRHHNWQVDWDQCQPHLDAARRLYRSSDLPGAFREFCLGMLPLMEAIHRQRNKEESFKPLWDKTPA